MMTKEQIAQALAGVNVADLHAASGVSVKTIYRYRSGTNHSPRLDTVNSLLAAAALLRKRQPKVPA